MPSIVKKVYWPVIAFLIIQEFIPNELFWMLGLVFCLYYIVFCDKWKLIIPHKESKILFLFIIWGGIIGSISILQGKVVVIDMVRDVFYFSNPLIFMYIGAEYSKRDINIFKILNAFVIASAVLSIIELFNIVQNSALLLSSFSVYGWRSVTGDGVVVMGISLAIVFAGIIPKEQKLPNGLVILLTIITGAYFLLSLSRTNMMIVTIMYSVLVLQKGNVKKVFARIICMLIVVLVGLIIVNKILPESISSAYIEKIISSLTEIRSTNSWNSITEIQSNWRGYEVHCAVAQWEREDVLNQIFGAGFGSRIYVGNYAYTLLEQLYNGKPATTIAVLHNGYATQLIKLGLLGVVVYVLYYFLMIKKAWKAIKKGVTLEGRLLLSVILVLLIQTYFLNGLFKDYCFYPMMVLIGFCAYNIQKALYWRGKNE